MIIVVGDIMIDEFVFCKTTRISPEAPIPVLEEISRLVRPGGAGNVAENIHTLGGDVHLYGVAGRFEASCDEVFGWKDRVIGGALTYNIWNDDGRPTTRKTRYIVGDRHVARVDREDTRVIPCQIESAIDHNVRQLIEDCDPSTTVLVISDYDKGVCTQTLCRSLIRAARERGVYVIVDPKKSQWFAYEGADLVTPNLSHRENSTPQEMTKFNVLTTKGRDGMMLIYSGPGGAVKTFDAEDVHAVDPTGAGDVVVAAIAHKMAEKGRHLEAAIGFAITCAAISVTKFGTTTVSYDDVIRYREERDIAASR